MADIDVAQIPAGNWIAHQLRLINDDSKKLLPSTAGSKRSYRKYDSLYTVDFEDFPDGALETRFLDKKNLEEIQAKRETISDVLFNSSTREQGQMFANWRIPDRILDKDSHRTRLPSIRRSAPGTTLLLPQSSKGTPKLASRSAMVVSQSAAQQKMPSKSAGAAKYAVSKSLPVSPVQRSRSVGTDSRGRLKEDLRASLQPRAVGLAEDWMKRAPHVERRVIEKILHMQERRNQLDHALRKTLLPDARQAIDKWLDTASENDRQVALKFFTSLAGSKLVGTTAEEQRNRLQQVITTLQRNKGRGTPRPSPKRADEIDDSCRLQFIKLLDPSTRARRWQHTTWHHLPEYRNNDPVNNWSSHFVKPNVPLSRHFVIHPDWG